MPYERRVQVFTWKGVTFAPLVCLDAYDSGIVASLAIESHRSVRGFPLDLIVVPSMNEDKLAGATKLSAAISHLTLSPVLLVDSSGPMGVAGYVGHALFWDGVNNTPDKYQVAQRTSWFTVDLSGNRSAQRRLTAARRASKHWALVFRDERESEIVKFPGWWRRLLRRMQVLVAGV
jgi:hypothetical protein